MDPLEDRTRDIFLCSPVADLVCRVVPPFVAGLFLGCYDYVALYGLPRGLQFSFVSCLRRTASFVPIYFVLLLLHRHVLGRFLEHPHALTHPSL